MTKQEKEGHPLAEDPLEQAFPWANIRIVLVETSHPGNIGGVARAMKNMQLESLYLVRPHAFPDPAAVARASGATDVLDNAVICDDLARAIGGCRLVVAATARSRSIEWPRYDAPQAARELTRLAHAAPVALVFGRESSGLNNDELDHCNAMVTLPANPAFSSLNLACAVQVLAYEVRLAVMEGWTKAGHPADGLESLPASADNLQQLFDHLEKTLLKIHFMPPHRAESLMRKLRRFYYRSGISDEEVSIFRGIISELDRLDALAVSSVEVDKRG